MLNIGLGHLTTSVKYMCETDYEYTLDENLVKCTDNGSYTPIGKCVKGKLLIFLYICY